MKHWKQKGAAMLAACLLAAGPFAAAQPAFAQGTETAPAVYIDNEEQSFNPGPVVKDSRVYLPMRALYEALGAEVEWNAEKEEVTASLGEKTTVLPLSMPYAWIDGVLTPLDTPAYEENGRTMVPLRFAGESLGLAVSWDGARNRVDITTGNAAEGEEEKDSKGEAQEDRALTYEGAAKLAVKKDQSLYSIRNALGKVSDANERIYLTPGSYEPTMIQQKKNLNVQEKWLEQQLGLAAQGISINAKSQMDQISMLAEKLALLNDTKKYQDYALQMAQLKYDYGMLSRVELDTLQSKVNQTAVSIELCRANIEAGWLALNAALGRDLTERGGLEYSFSYKPVTEAELTEKLRTCTQDDPYLWFARQNLDLADYRLRTYDYMTDYYQGGLSYPVAEINLAEAKNDVKQTEQNLREQIQIRYNKLRQLELSIDQKEMTLADALRNQRIVQMKYEAGMATKAEVMEAELAFPTAVQEIRELQLQHSQLRNTFDQPYLNPDYASGGSSSSKEEKGSSAE